MSKNNNDNWHSLSATAVIKKLKSDKKGLTSKQAKLRLNKHGKNELPKSKGVPWLVLLWNQIKSPLVYVLIAAGFVSLILAHYTDAIVILIVVFINTIFGFYQEAKADKAINRLRQIVRQNAVVLRDGKQKKVEAKNLVLGDIIILYPGDKVPADARIIESDNLQAVEAALTGESSPSNKKNKKLKIGRSLADRENMIYMGTVISRGKGVAIVCKTGKQTEIGKISALLKDAKEEKTPLQNKMTIFSRWLTIIILVVASLVFVEGYLVGKPVQEMFLISVALAVAAIPEGLLVAMTIIFTVGMQKILKKKALVKRLVAAETLGSTSVICFDKTGTLTEGNMRVSKIITAEKEYMIKAGAELAELEKERELISKVSVLCTSAAIENPEAELEHIRIIGDPTEKALLLAAIQSGFEKGKLEADYIKKHELPFDSAKKYMATLHYHKSHKHSHIFVKGAPEKIFKFSNRVLSGGNKIKLSKKKLAYLQKKYRSLTKKGLRVLAVAYKTGHFSKLENELNELVFLGFVALKDPLRQEAKNTIKLCKKAGIRPVLITGDHLLTAKAVYNEINSGKKRTVVEGFDLDKWSDKDFKKEINNIDIYARVEPRHKMRVVDAWQEAGEVVAMTGDGINDAPALKASDIGIALGGGSDVTKETADIILLDNNFSVIVKAVEQGRVIFDNIRKVVLYLLSDSFSEIILISGALLLGLPLPLLATQILWINLAADGLPTIAMAFEPGEKEIMLDKPRPKTEPILNKEMKVLIFIIGIITNIFLLAIFAILMTINADIAYIRTIIFAALGLDSLIYVFSIRSLRHSIFTKNPFSNKHLIIAVVIGVSIMVAAIHIPILQSLFQTVALGRYEWFGVIALAFLKLILVEIVKHYFIVNKYKKNAKAKFA